MLERAVHSHIITSHFGAPLLIETGGGLIVEITDGDNYGYRGNLSMTWSRRPSYASLSGWRVS